MKFQIDHDYHIHSQLSSCSRDPEQSTERILRYAAENGLRDICLADHFWDETVPGASSWYQKQDYAHIRQSLPLPQNENVRFHFGCETEMDKYYTVGISEHVMQELEFVIIPTTHLHMRGFTLREPEDMSIERRAVLYITRLEALLDKKYPAEKVGIAHLACHLIAPDGQYLDVLDSISDNVFRGLFEKVAQVGYGVELNMPAVYGSLPEQESAMRPFRIAKECGCKFYLGSDAHHPEEFDGIIENFRGLVELLDLHESDKFRPFG